MLAAARVCAFCGGMLVYIAGVILFVKMFS